ncbi:hypothetical protein [Bradyrhizobium sp. CCBAU 45389]|uniref:hypothetical protein n=1 Tax=Bradyrhizobium sp. CCBAU 45389 TaxID=858429 RepID=UPI0023069122|nr:hypothetical protein [Bradyrhizobium sp. CCBAU 45389]
MNEQFLDPLIGQLEEVETVAAGGPTLAVIVSHHLERALAPCHVVLSRQPALSFAGWRLVCGTLKTCCDILQAGVRLPHDLQHAAMQNETSGAKRLSMGGELL